MDMDRNRVDKALVSMAAPVLANPGS
jgi:hypothetical protein